MSGKLRKPDEETEQNLTITDTVIERVERTRPGQANYLRQQNVHGGELVRQMDDLAAVSAMTHAGTTCVTACIDNVEFRESVPIGHLAEITAFVYDTGETSLETYVSVDHRDPRNRGRSKAVEARFVLVAVDEKGNPQSVPDIQVADANDEELLSEVHR